MAAPLKGATEQILLLALSHLLAVVGAVHTQMEQVTLVGQVAAVQRTLELAVQVLQGKVLPVVQRLLVSGQVMAVAVAVQVAPAVVVCLTQQQAYKVVALTAFNG
jgi:hypothetical protein